MITASTIRNGWTRQNAIRLAVGLGWRPKNVPLLLKKLALLALLLTTVPGAWAQTQTLTVVLSPAASITTPATISLTKVGSTFGSFTTPATSIQFDIRNTQASGGGSITLKAAEFTPTTGPKIASGNLTYVCNAASLGTPCSGTQTLSTTTATPVVTFPASSCTGAGCTGTSPQSVQVLFTLTDSSQYKTATYSATLTFTVSAT